MGRDRLIEAIKTKIVTIIDEYTREHRVIREKDLLDWLNLLENDDEDDDALGTKPAIR